MFNIGPLELMVILLLALVVVGPSRLPEVGRSIGKGLRELRKVQDEVRDSINFNLDEPIRPPKPTPAPRASRTPEPPASDLDDATWPPPAGAADGDEGGAARAPEAPEDLHDGVDAPRDPVGPAVPETGSANGSAPVPETPPE